jgi:hypothetical protein
MADPPRLPAIHVNRQPLIESGVSLSSRLTYPLLNLTIRHSKRVTTPDGSLINRHIDLVASVPPLHARIAENLTQLPLKQCDDPSKTGFVTNLAFRQLVQNPVQAQTQVRVQVHALYTSP